MLHPAYIAITMQNFFYRFMNCANRSWIVESCRLEQANLRYTTYDQPCCSAQRLRMLMRTAVRSLPSMSTSVKLGTVTRSMPSCTK